METTFMTILLVLVIGALCIVCFFIGAKVGQKVNKGETLEVPNLNPVKVFEEYKESKEAKFEQERNKIISDNIDAYDGTSIGQKKLPNRQR